MACGRIAPKTTTRPVPSGMVPSAVFGEAPSWGPTVATVVPLAASHAVRVMP